MHCSCRACCHYSCRACAYLWLVAFSHVLFIIPVVRVSLFLSCVCIFVTCMYVAFHMLLNRTWTCWLGQRLAHADNSHKPALCFTLVVFKLFIHKCIVHVHVGGHWHTHMRVHICSCTHFMFMHMSMYMFMYMFVIVIVFDLAHES